MTYSFTGYNYQCGLAHVRFFQQTDYCIASQIGELRQVSYEHNIVMPLISLLAKIIYNFFCMTAPLLVCAIRVIKKYTSNSSENVCVPPPGQELIVKLVQVDVMKVHVATTCTVACQLSEFVKI